jgi:hypothetical protein
VAKTNLKAAIQQVANWLRPFVGLRDGFIVMGACVYFLGYILWALYAALEHLGNVPLLSTQYLTAGTIVGAFLAIAWFIGRGLWWTREFIASWLDPTIHWEPTVQWKLTLAWCLQRVSTLAFLTFAFSSFVINDDRIGLIAIYTFAFTAFFAPEVKEIPKWTDRLLNWAARRPRSKYYFPLIASMLRPDKFFRRLGTFYGYLFTAFIPLISLVLAFVLFTKVPQELGRPRPRCAYLDLDRQMMSVRTQQDLIPKSELSNSRVARSIPLDVLFFGGDSVRVRTQFCQGHSGIRNKPEADHVRTGMRLITKLRASLPASSSRRKAVWCCA